MGLGGARADEERLADLGVGLAPRRAGAVPRVRAVSDRAVRLRRSGSPAAGSAIEARTRTLRPAPARRQRPPGRRGAAAKEASQGLPRGLHCPLEFARSGSGRRAQARRAALRRAEEAGGPRGHADGSGEGGHAGAAIRPGFLGSPSLPEREAFRVAGAAARGRPARRRPEPGSASVSAVPKGSANARKSARASSRIARRGEVPLAVGGHAEVRATQGDQALVAKRRAERQRLPGGRRDPVVIPRGRATHASTCSAREAARRSPSPPDGQALCCQAPSASRKSPWFRAR